MVRTWTPSHELSTDSHVVQAYICGNALNILTGPHTLLQTIYHDGCSALDSVVISESTGKIATCDTRAVYIHRPYGQREGGLKVFMASNNLGHLANPL